MSDIVIITRFPADFNVLGGRPVRLWGVILYFWIDGSQSVRPNVLRTGCAVVPRSSEFQLLLKLIVKIGLRMSYFHGRQTTRKPITLTNMSGLP